MEFLHAIKLLAVFMFLHGVHGVPTLTGDPVVEQGNNTVFTCTPTSGTGTPIYQWIDGTAAVPVTIFSGGNRFNNNPKYDNFAVISETAAASQMRIETTEVEDEGTYSCQTQEGASDPPTVLTVEVPSSRSLDPSSTVINNEDLYVVTCEATGGKPMETIEWILNGVPQSNGNGNDIQPSNPSATAPLSNTKSVFTFPANIENYGQTLVCDITGHILTDLNGQVSTVLDFHTSPDTANTMVTVGWVTEGSGISVSCTAVNQPDPTMRNYYIYANDTLIHQSTTEVSDVTVSDPEAGTQYTCIAGNYLGNTSISEPDTYDPARTTTPPSTTEPITTEGTTDGTGTSAPPASTSPSQTNGTDPHDPSALSGGAIAGIAIGALLVVIIIVVLIIVFVLKPDCVSGLGSSSGGGGGPKKHGSSSVGSSNGNDKNDVEAPLKGVNEVVTEDNFKPTPQPRQSSIKHTNENPGMAEYAMVDRKPKASSGGDMPDTRGNGAGQNEQPGMHYADLDLTAGAGHTEEKVPQNPDNVVVYSSILV